MVLNAVPKERPNIDRIVSDGALFTDAYGQTLESLLPA